MQNITGEIFLVNQSIIITGELINYSVMILAIAVYLGFATYRTLKKQEVEISDILRAVLSAKFIPTSIAIIIIAFNSGDFSEIEDLGFTITVAALVLLHVSIKTVFSKFHSGNPP